MSIGRVSGMVVQAHPSFFNADGLLTLGMHLLEDTDLWTVLLEEMEHQGTFDR